MIQRAMEPAPIARGSLRADRTADPSRERIETLISQEEVRVERIISLGQASPPGFWYEQPQREWVLVLEGRAALEIDGEPAPVELAPGDWIDIPARRRHRVLWTAAGEPTLWLAVHYGARR